MDTQEDIWEDQMVLEEGILGMLHDFFYDDLPHEEANVLDKEEKKRHKHEFEIKEKCNKMLYEGAKVSKVQVLLSLLNLQTIYGWPNVKVLTLFQLLFIKSFQRKNLCQSHVK